LSGWSWSTRQVRPRTWTQQWLPVLD